MGHECCVGLLATDLLPRWGTNVLSLYILATSKHDSTECYISHCAISHPLYKPTPLTFLLSYRLTTHGFSPRSPRSSRRPNAWARTWSPSPSWRSPAILPRTCCSSAEFVQANLDALLAKSPARPATTAVVGFVDRSSDLYNAAAICQRGQLAGVYHKMFLPNYGVFDEKRYFCGGATAAVSTWAIHASASTSARTSGTPGRPAGSARRRPAPSSWSTSPPRPTTAARPAAAGAHVSPRAADVTPWASPTCNLVGGQDELVFDGNSLVLSIRDRASSSRAAAFAEDLVRGRPRPRLACWRRRHPAREAARAAERWRCPPSIEVGPTVCDRKSRRSAPEPSRASGWRAEVYEALVLGTRDYVDKNGFKKVVLGLSGGIDSAWWRPSPSTRWGRERRRRGHALARTPRDGSDQRRRALAPEPGHPACCTIPIEQVLRAVPGHAWPAFCGEAARACAEENLQARIRGNILMALSNKFGWLVLTTGNKSETGRRLPHALRRHGRRLRRHQGRAQDHGLRAGRATATQRRGARAHPAAPSSTKPPSAELRPDQKDTDSLPPYEVLDPILDGLRRGGQERRARSWRWASTQQMVRRVIAHWWTAASTSAGRRRRASRSRRAPSAATDACRSPTASGEAPRDRTARPLGQPAAALDQQPPHLRARRDLRARFAGGRGGDDLGAGGAGDDDLRPGAAAGAGLVLLATMLIGGPGDRVGPLRELVFRPRPYLEYSGIRQIGIAWAGNWFPSAHATSVVIATVLLGSEYRRYC